VRVRRDAVPDDIAAERFFSAMTAQVLAAAPVTSHIRARELISRGTIAPD